MSNQLFISYSRRDKAFIERLVKQLRERAIDPWVDWEDIPVGVLWQERIFKGIEESVDFCFASSSYSLASPHCLAELSHAVGLNKRLLPILVPGFGLIGLLPPALNQIQAVSFEDFEEGFNLLFSALYAPRGINLDSRLDSRLTLWTGTSPSRYFILYPGKYRIGRSRTISEEGVATISCDDPQMSRKHLELELIQGRWLAKDMSRNGCLLNGRPFTARILKHRDTIHLTQHTHLLYEEIVGTELLYEGDDRETLT